MRKTQLLSFALGVATIASLGAATNQVLSLQGQVTGLSNEGVIFPDGTMQTSAASADPRRAFYLTESEVMGGATLTACATGFRMATAWELYDPSNLRYASDSEGAGDVHREGTFPGPSSGREGWIRVGYGESGILNDLRSGCSGWTSSDPSHFGTHASLHPVSSPPFSFAVGNCDDERRVWCVQD
jgi:hypothetical protein